MTDELTTTSKRLRILEPEEIESLYGLPNFTDDDRIAYFNLTPNEKAALQQLRTRKSRLYFVLQLGYFKARYQFFLFSIHDVIEDAYYVQQLYFPDVDLADDFAMSKVTRLNQQAVIRGLFAYEFCSEEDRDDLRRKAGQAARIYAKPIYIFRELLAYLIEQRLVVPAYSTMQDIVSDGLVHEEDRLIATIQTLL